MIVKTVLKSQASQYVIEKGLEFLKQEYQEVLKNVKENLPLLEDMVKNLTGEIKGIVYGEEVAVLSVETIAKIAREYVVKGSTEVVACKQETAEGIYVYLAYSVNRELLPIDKNAYVIIKAKELSTDLQDLFGEESLIILN